MSIALFSENLGNFPADRARRLDAQFGIEAVYALVWPDYAPPNPPVPQNNRAEFDHWRDHSAVPTWCWINCRADQLADAEKIRELDLEYNPAGWLLDIEGEWTKGASLKVVCEAAVAMGKPVRASLAGFSPSGSSLDFRTFDRLGIPVDWQAYFDSGEGPDPAYAVRELYQSSFVVPGWEYRARLGKTYGMGKVTRVEGEQVATYDSYKRPGGNDATFAVTKREWGFNVAGRGLMRGGKNVGLLMGRASYANTRVTLDVTRTAQNRKPEEWVSIASAARVPGAKKVGVSVYLAENASDEVLAGIAAGAA